MIRPQELIIENRKSECLHMNILVITEIPTDGINQQTEKIFVKCADCSEILPIQTITTETRYVPLVVTPVEN